MNARVPFAKTEDGVKLMASYLAECVRQGVTVEVQDDSDNFYVLMTGDY